MLCPDFGYGGAERSFAKVAELLAENHEVTCVAFNGGVQQFYSLGPRIEFLDVKRWRFSIWRFIHRVRRLRLLVKRVRADVVVSFLEGADYINFFSGAPRRLASIRGSKVHDVEITGFKGVLRRVLMRCIYPRVDGVIPVSVAIGEEMRRHFNVTADRLWVISNFYDVTELQEVARRPLPPWLEDAFSGSDVWISVGRLHKQKNQSFLLRLFAKVRPNYPNARLVLVGDGPEQAVLASLCEELGLTFDTSKNDCVNVQAEVWFLGYQACVPELLARSKLFLLPSLSEGFPNALVEAMACGVPSIAADCVSGPSEILDLEPMTGEPVRVGRGGILVTTPDSPDHQHIKNWSDAIELALSQREQLIAAATLRVQDFTRTHAAHKWDAVLSGTHLPYSCGPLP